MQSVTPQYLAERLALAEVLLSGRDSMVDPQDLPGRYGRVVAAVDRVLAAIDAPAVLSGGWAVWRHGFVGRVTQDMDIVVAADVVEDFLKAAAVAGFEAYDSPTGRWPKLLHRDTGIEVDLLPEGQRPGTPSHPAPTTIRHPTQLGAAGSTLRYVSLQALVELKLAAGRARDEADVVELIRTNDDQLDVIRDHLAGVHHDYVEAFDHLAQRAADEDNT
ncbi:MAG: hypothetical protein IID44_22045 [Planctomycetes bacterium]|nr:hypothetical protein [Planctomycetota bacterium]